MAKRKTIRVLIVWSVIALFEFQTFSQTGGLNEAGKPGNDETPQNVNGHERKREISKTRKQWRQKLERRQKQLEKESVEHSRQAKAARGQRKHEIEKLQKEGHKAIQNAGGFIFEKYALGVTEEQWELIRAKLEKVRQLREQVNSVVGMSLSGGSSDNQISPGGRARPKVPTWQWKDLWKDKTSSELTEAQKLTNRLISLIKSNRTTPEQFRRTMDALRKARREEAELERQLTEAREGLRDGLTTRQEATLVLLQWY